MCLVGSLTSQMRSFPFVKGAIRGQNIFQQSAGSELGMNSLGCCE